MPRTDTQRRHHRKQRHRLTAIIRKKLRQKRLYFLFFITMISLIFIASAKNHCSCYRDSDGSIASHRRACIKAILQKNEAGVKRESNMGSSKKKLFKGHFRIMWAAWGKKNFCNGILGQRTISVQIFKIFGCHQNHGY